MSKKIMSKAATRRYLESIKNRKGTKRPHEPFVKEQSEKFDEVVDCSKV